jgi:hypothetical protein
MAMWPRLDQRALRIDASGDPEPHRRLQVARRTKMTTKAIRKLIADK